MAIDMEQRVYDLLERKPGEDIPYVRGTNYRIRAETLYTSFHANREIYKTLADLAKDAHLPVSEVRQAIKWCEENQSLLALVLAQERKEAGVKD